VKRQREAPLRLRRSSNIVCYWAQNRLVHHNFATGAGLVAGPRAVEVLDVFGDWRSVEEAAAHLPHWNRRTLQRAVADLTRSGLLHRADRRPPDTEPRLEEWAGWNPAAGFFHQATKNVDYRLPVKPGRGRAGPAAPPPPPFKHVPSSTVIHLPAERQNGELPQVLGARRTWRRFGRGAIDVQDVATMMGLTWRVRHWVPNVQGGLSALRTSPSGGACQPLEAYVLALRVRDIERGLYHYSPERHTLALVRKGATARDVERYLAGQWWYKDAAAVVLISAVFARKRRRYCYARAYRSILAEAGHFCQTFCLVATWLGLAPFCTMALRDSAIEEALGIDGIGESVLYAAGVGTRPRSSADASRAPGVIPFD
jgi:SagB-type dehydrogenase family enzyme